VYPPQAITIEITSGIHAIFKTLKIEIPLLLQHFVPAEASPALVHFSSGFVRLLRANSIERAAR
jgi:hypothetical protein